VHGLRCSEAWTDRGAARWWASQREEEVTGHYCHCGHYARTLGGLRKHAQKAAVERLREKLHESLKEP